MSASEGPNECYAATRAERSGLHLNSDSGEEIKTKTDRRHRELSLRDREHAAKHLLESFISGYGWLKDMLTKIHISQKMFLRGQAQHSRKPSNSTENYGLSRKRCRRSFLLSTVLHARRVGNYVWNRLPGANKARCGEYDCWTLRAVLYNQYTHIHHDKNDEKAGYAAITRFGSFKGGDFVIVQLKCKFASRPGDVVFLKGRALDHYVIPWEGIDVNGERGGLVSIVHTNHETLVYWASKGFEQLTGGQNLVNARLHPMDSI